MANLSDYFKDLMTNQSIYMKGVIYSKIYYDLIKDYYSVNLQKDYLYIFENSVFKPLILSILIVILLSIILKFTAIILLNISDFLGRKLFYYKPKLSMLFIQKKWLRHFIISNNESKISENIANNIFLLVSFLIYLFFTNNYFLVSIIFLVTFFFQNMILSYNRNMVKYLLDNFDFDKQEWKNLTEKEKNENVIYIK
jgi:hypothetical protein